MKSKSLAIRVQYDISEVQLRQDLTKCGHSFIAYAQPPKHESEENGVKVVNFCVWWRDKPLTNDLARSFIERANCRQATQIEMRSLASWLRDGNRPEGESELDYSAPFQCFGTEWTYPSEFAGSHLTVPCFTLQSMRIKWDLPMAEGLFPSAWNFVGVEGWKDEATRANEGLTYEV